MEVATKRNVNEPQVSVSRLLQVSAAALQECLQTAQANPRPCSPLHIANFAGMLN